METSKKREVRSDRELQLDLMLFVLFLCFYAYMVGVTFGQLRERNRLLNLREAVRDNSLEGVYFVENNNDGLGKAQDFLETLKKREKTHRTPKETEKVTERIRPDKKPPDHTHESGHL